jgi:hypothetical protein
LYVQSTEKKEENIMKKLPDKFRKNGYDFELVERVCDIAIYAVQTGTTTKTFEVFEVQKLAARVVGNKIIEAREASPSNEAWGTKGFTYGNLDDAKKRAKQYVRRQSKSRNPQTSKL